MVKDQGFRLGLGTSLALAIGLLAIALTALVVKIAGVRASAEIRGATGHELEELAFQTTDKLDRGMFERYREVQLMAGRRLLSDPAVSPAEKRKAIEQMQETYPSYAWIGLTDPGGKVLVATGKLLEGADVSKQAWFGDVTAKVYLHDVHEDRVLAGMLPRTGNEPKRFFDVAFPYFQADGKLAGVLGTHLGWQWTADVQRSVFGPVAKRSKVETMIVARDGTVLLGPADMMGKKLDGTSFKAAAMSGNGYLSETWNDGKQYLVGYSRSLGYLSYPGFGWTVLVRQELAEAYRPVYALQRAILLAGVLAALAFSLLGYPLARRITRPVAALARLAGEVEQGRAGTFRMGKSRFREMATLSGALDSLVEKLAEKEASLRRQNALLEEQLSARTAELHRTMDALARDNAERRKTEQALRQSQHRLASISDNLPVAILYIDERECFRFVNKTYESWFRCSAESLIGRRLEEVYKDTGAGGARYGEIKAYVRRALAGEQVVFEVQRMIASEQRHVEVHYIPDIDPNGRELGFYALMNDVTDHKNLQLHFEHDAKHDALTGLPNRKAFMDQLELALARAERSGKPLAVLFLDLDKFKDSKDAHGHAVGDEVLVYFAETLRQCVRKTDTVGRLSDKAFAILAEELASGESDAMLIAEKIIASLRAHEGAALSASIGIAVQTDRRGKADELLARADAAMQRSKASGSDWTVA
jgi:diguanylate cyclase (GGDEF)-like protein/PAS domain S-box-containing protein